jgi:VanZ family protein
VLSQAPGTDNQTSAELLDLISLSDYNGLARMLAHMTVFGILALLIYGAIGRGRWTPVPRWFAGTLALTALLATLDELHQHFVPWRHGRPIDVFFDLIGATLVLVGVLTWHTIRSRRDGATGELVESDGGS